jgi:membrane associated rhomboid family serine protease
MSDSSKKPLWGADNNALVALLAVNLVVAVTFVFMKVTYYLEGFPAQDFQNEIYQYVILLPSNIKMAPWTFISFNWTHDNFWALFTNLFWLFVFGNILQNVSANKHLFPIYFYSGLIAATSYVLHNGQEPLIGAQTSVLAIALATLIIAPTYKTLSNIGKGIPAWLLIIIYLIITGLSFKDITIEHSFSIFLGGLSGLLYAFLLKKEIDLGAWMHHLLRSINNSLTPKS